MRQLGDPVAAAAGLCQHHGVAYAEMTPVGGPVQKWVKTDFLSDGAILVQVPITTTETCCVVVNAAIMTGLAYAVTDFEIERPLGTIRTQQEDSVSSQEFKLMHHAAWEVLPAGNYTYFLVNRSGTSRDVYGAWIKAIASDCLG